MTLRHLSLACTLMLAGCPFIKTSTSTSLPGGTSSSSSSPSSDGAAASSGDSDKRKEAPNLIGLSIAEATKTIKAHGFDGKVEVMEQSQFDETCKADTVCSVQSTYWYLNQDHSVTLYKNKAISIAVPE